MVNCCVTGCNNKSFNNRSISYHRFPKDTERKRKWMTAINRKDWEPSQHSRVCGVHFISGKKSDQPLNPDYIPNLNLGYEKNDATPATKSGRLQRRIEREEHVYRSDAALALLDLQNATQPDNEKENVSHCETLQQEDVHGECARIIAGLRIENGQLKDELSRLQLERDTMQKEISKAKAFKFSADFIKDSDSKTTFFSGLPSYASFVWLITFLNGALPVSQCLSPGSVLLLILMKLKLNLINQDLAMRFFISEGHVSDLLNKGLPGIAKKLAFLVQWPDKEQTIRNMPQVVKALFKNCRCIIDCTEVFIERPGNLTARASTWSNYKHNNTLKFLIAINPCGSISFISKAFGGRTSDKVVTQRSGFLDLLEYGDVVLADRGFLISDELSSRNATLVIPAFTKGQLQLSQKEVETTRKIARVRIHVERAIGRLKLFKIMNGLLPISMVPHSDSIATICSALCNLHPQLVN